MRPLIRRAPILDPAPSRWRYRVHRLMLTPLFRAFLKVGVPAFLIVFIAGAWLSSAENRGRLTDGLADLRAQIEQRPEFTVRLMAIDGAEDALREEIRAVLPYDFPLSSFDIDLEEARATVAALNAVESATIRIRPGGILQVDVTPRVPVAVWRGHDGLKLIDLDGRFVAPLPARAERADLPLVAGDGARDVVGEALDLIAAAGPLQGDIRGLVRMGERRWDIVLASGQRLLLPEDRPRQALERIIALDQARDMLSRDVTVVDMRNAARPVLRLTDSAADGLRQVRGLETQ